MLLAYVLFSDRRAYVWLILLHNQQIRCSKEVT
jgi:hypothetical protein